MRWGWRSILPVGILLIVGCTGVQITRIGPRVPAREADCQVQILAAGQVPVRPYRDVGKVFFASCEDYTAPPCRQWLQKAACQLGGEVAYGVDKQPADGRSDNVYAADMAVTVAVYVASLAPSYDDPVLNATEIGGCSGDAGVVAQSADTPEAQMCGEE